jgi:hypothetical protein
MQKYTIAINAKGCVIICRAATNTLLLFQYKMIIGY